MMRLTRLLIHRYRGVEPDTELRFSRGINVILGKNGTGKTTLLNLIAMIARSDFSPLKDEDFHFAFTMEIGTAQVEMTLEGRHQPNVEHLTELSGQDLEVGWTYRIEVSGEHPIATLSVEDGIVVESSGNLPTQSKASRWLQLYAPRMLARVALIFLQSRQDRDSVPARLWFLRTQGPGFPSLDEGRFDEGLAVFRRIIGDISVMGSASLPEATSIDVVPVFDSSGEVRGEPMFAPAELSDLLAKHWSIEKSTESPSFTELEIATQIAQALNLRRVSIKPRFLQGDAEDARYTGITFTIALDASTTVTHDALSFGQKRRLAFLWYLASNPQGIVIADELVNGFHYEWIADSIADIGERQAFIASQNPLLLDFLTFDSSEEVRDAFVFCSAETRSDGRRGWNWKNMSEDEAESFYRAYSVGVQHVSGILRTKGLW